MSQASEIQARQPGLVDTPAVAEVYAEHAKFVWRNLRRLGVAPEAVEDAVQDVFLVVHLRLSEFEGRSTVRTWLFAILLRVAGRYRERGRTTRQRFDPEAAALLEQLVASGADGPLELAVQRQAADFLYAILASLDEGMRSMFVLVELEQMNVVEAAQVLDINLNTAHTRLKRARAEFQKQAKRARSQSWRPA